jgi:AcrR family transcriptional regulator
MTAQHATANSRKKTAAVEIDRAREQFTPDDWINAAKALLIDHGVDAVRVDVLSKQLGVTRGSFYWHFKNRDDLLRRLLKSWRDHATEQVISRFEQTNATPAELIRELLMLPFHGRAAAEAASTELAIRGWARRDAMARQVVDEVDAQRLSYIAQCFSSLGHSIAEARARAFALYAYELAESLLHNQGTDGQKAERNAFLERALLAPAAMR